MKTFIKFLLVASLAGMGGTFAHAQSFQIEEFESPAGHSIWLVEDRSNPIVTAEIRFASGSYHDPVGLEGVSQILGWLFNEGAGDLDAQAFQGIMTDESFSISANARLESTTITLQFLTENQDQVFDLLTLALDQPRFDASAIERAKAYLESQVQRRMNGPGEEFNEVMGPLRYGEDHPFLRFGNGTLESLAAITRDDILTAHARTYVTQGVEVNAVGDINQQDLAALVDRALSGLAVGTPRNQRPAPSDPAQNIEVVVDFPNPVTYVSASANGIDFNDNDLRAARVANQILGGEGLSSRLFASVREEAGLVYGINSSMAAARDYGRVGFAFQTANDTVDEALALTLDVFREFAENGPTQDEVDSAIALITGGYPLRFQTSSAIVEYMGTLRTLNLPPEFPTYRNAEFEKVTIEDVQRVAKRLYAEPNFLIGMIGRPENREPGVRALTE